MVRKVPSGWELPRMEVFIRNFKKKEPLSDTKFYGCEAFSPLRGTNSEPLPPVIFVCPSTQNGTTKASSVEFLRLNTLRDTKKCFFDP